MGIPTHYLISLGLMPSNASKLNLTEQRLSCNSQQTKRKHYISVCPI